MTGTDNLLPDGHERRFSRDEVESILRHALERQRDGAITMSDLIATAGELGIDPESLRGAVRQHDLERQRETGLSPLQRRRTHYMRMVRTLIVLNVLLIVVNAMAGGVPWSIFLLASWGLPTLFGWIRTSRRILRLSAAPGKG